MLIHADGPGLGRELDLAGTTASVIHLPGPLHPPLPHMGSAQPWPVPPSMLGLPALVILLVSLGGHGKVLVFPLACLMLAMCFTTALWQTALGEPEFC